MSLFVIFAREKRRRQPNFKMRYLENYLEYNANFLVVLVLNIVEHFDKV